MLDEAVLAGEVLVARWAREGPVVGVRLLVLSQAAPPIRGI